jgi:predicted ArsR family transcriptional regulator
MTVQQNRNRRDFLKMLSAGPLLCLGCGFLGATPRGATETVAQNKFKTDSKFSFEQLFDFAYSRTIDILKGLEKRIGKEQLLKMLKEDSEKSAEEHGRRMASQFPANDLASFSMIMKKPDHFWEHVLSLDILEDRDTVFEVKVRECLWAKTFKKFKGENFGYPLICHGDFAMARGFNPRMKLQRTHTLMQGHGFCNHRWSVRA